MSAIKRGASLSPELGNDNKRLRRSERKSAGRKSLPNGYLATDTAVKDEVGRGSDVENDSDDSMASGRWTRKKRKALRVPSPEPEPLPEDDCATNAMARVEPALDEPAPTPSTSLPHVSSELSLTFNVPNGKYSCSVSFTQWLMIPRAHRAFRRQAQSVRFASPSS